MALHWVRGLFRFDVVLGTEVLVENLQDSGKFESRKRAVKTFSAVFGERNNDLFSNTEPDKRARILGQLVRTAYEFVKHDEDQQHEGVYSPDTRDDAQMARNLLLSQLLETPGEVAHRTVMGLVGEPEFAHFPDRLKLLARQRAATEAEFSPLTPSEVRTLDTAFEAPAKNRDSLFAVMIDRLGEISYELLHGDFSNRRTLQSVKHEREMQKNLARELANKGNGIFQVSREEEVIDGKHPDLRLVSMAAKHKVSLEVKIADNWSVCELEKALSVQLQQYVRDPNCRAGLLVLTYHGKKRYWLPGDGKRMYFDALVARLQTRAEELDRDESQDIRTAVFGLDLTGPE